MDIAVIVVFSGCFSVGVTLLSGEPFAIGSIIMIFIELAASIALGYLVGAVVHVWLSKVVVPLLRYGAVLLAGYGVYVGSAWLGHHAQAVYGLHFHLEPLLICMVASFAVTNHTTSRRGLTRLLHHLCPPVYVAFFTLTGASLQLDVLPATWHIAVALGLVRLAGMWVGNHVGGRLAGTPPLHNRVGALAYLTQAGVALGLAKNLASAFPGWGASLATTIVALIVINQVVGPPLLKWTLARVGEDRSRAATAEADGENRALLFGIEGQSITLARVLVNAGWHVRIACPEASTRRRLDIGVDVVPIDTIDLPTLREVGLDRADAVVGLMSDALNLRTFELAFQNFGTRTLVTRLGDRGYLRRFEELGVIVIDPRSAVISLLDRSVRSPMSATLLLGGDEQDIIDVEVTNPDVNGLAVRELRLPIDVAVMYVHHADGAMVSAKGTTRLQVGERVTLSGPHRHLQQATLKLTAS